MFPASQILRNNADGTDKGTLLWLMDHTHTPFGARLMRHWVSFSELSLLSRRNSDGVMTFGVVLTVWIPCYLQCQVLLAVEHSSSKEISFSIKIYD
jgi:hypothetical protein